MSVNSQHPAAANTAASVSASAITSPARRRIASAARVLLFAGLMWGAAAAGEIPIPGTPVPITLQTFVVMLAALTLNWREGAAAMGTYLAAGAAGLPVFAGGASTAALVGPSAGFLIGFLPGVIVTALLRGDRNVKANAVTTWLSTLRSFVAALIGCVAVVYAFGFLIQSALTGVSIVTVATASMGFVIGDIIKAVIATAAVTGINLLRR